MGQLKKKRIAKNREPQFALEHFVLEGQLLSKNSRMKSVKYLQILLLVTFPLFVIYVHLIVFSVVVVESHMV